MTRNERFERLLTVRLEELACAVESAGAPPERVARLLELASVATVQAVALELVSAERAETIWRGAKERHPALPDVEPVELPTRLAA
jgi:hypothetical protein